MEAYIFSNLPKLINSLGLLCDIGGAILIWRYSLPALLTGTGHPVIIDDDIDEEELEKGKKANRWGHIGMWLLIIGFAFQLVSNFTPTISVK